MIFIRRQAFFAILLAALLLAACSTSTPTPAAPVPTRLPALFTDVLEMQFNQPGAPLPDGPVAGLVGVYATPNAGENTLLLCQLDGATVQCNRYPVALDGITPGLVKVSGQMAGGVLTVSQAEPLAWDETTQRAAAQAKLDTLAEELARYDWSSIAAPEFGESSAWFRPDSARLMTIPLELYAYDSVEDLVIWRGQGWEMPKQTRTVYRFPVLYIVTDPAGERLAEAFVTIEGTTEE